MKILAISLLLLTAYSVSANDGSYRVHGSTLYPVKETKISMRKEVLSFTVREEVCRVDVQFEFFNPETTARKLKVGFQSPASVGDVPEESQGTPVSDFRVLYEGTILPYELKVAECEGCELKDPAKLKPEDYYGGLFVHLFEVTFKPGINRISHSYSFPASSNISFRQIYNYILTTGSKWAGGKIGDLTIEIDMGLNKYFYVNDVFGSKAKWSVTGSGKVTSKRFAVAESDSAVMVRILSGNLQVAVKDFKPTANIEFGIISEISFISQPTDFERINSGEVVTIDFLELSGTHSKKDLRIMRNTIYAQYGYAFTDPDLRSYFSKFEWYMPDPNLEMSDITLSEAEQKFVAQVIEAEQSN